MRNCARKRNLGARLVSGVSILEKESLKELKIHRKVMIVGTIIAAILGVQQNIINNRQNEINDNLIEISMRPDIDILYDDTRKVLGIKNSGEYTVYLDGIAYLGENFTDQPLGNEIGANGVIEHKMSPAWEGMLIAKQVHPSSRIRTHNVPYETEHNQFEKSFLGLRFRDERGEKYQLIVRIYFKIKSGKVVEPMITSLGAVPNNWESDTFAPPNENF